MNVGTASTKVRVSNQGKRTEPRLIAVDTETTGLDLRHDCKPFLVSTCTPEGEVKCWEWPVCELTRQPLIPSQEKRQIHNYLLGCTPVFHHAKFDIRALETIGISFRFYKEDWTTHDWEDDRDDCYQIECPTFHDTLLASHACSSSDKHGLKELGVKYLRYSDKDEHLLKEAVKAAARFCKSNDIEVSLGHSLTGDRAVGADYWLPKWLYDNYELPEEYEYFKDICLRYAGNDVERTILLHDVFSEVLDKFDLRKGYEREKRLLQVVYKMETGGITVSKKKLEDKITDLDKTSNQYVKKADKFVKSTLGCTINLRSQKELPNLLYRKLRLPKLKVSEKGNASCDKETLGNLMAVCDDKTSKHYNPYASQFLKNLLLSRAYESGSRYLVNYRSFGLPNQTAKSCLTLYPSLNQSGTGTTRFSSSNPNGQNVSKIATVEIGPNKEEFPGPRLRDVYVPPPGKIWYAIDYNQLELRVFAAASQEQSLISALDEGYDFHGFVSTQIFQKPIEQITKQERRIAKNTDFAIIFGASAGKVDATAGMPGAYKLFAGLFPNVHSYMRKTIKEVEKTGYTRTLDGYRLDVPLHEAYKGVNYKVQGTAGSIIKNAMIAIDRDGLVNWYTNRLLLQIHDELVVEFDKKSKDHTPLAVYKIMAAMEQAGADLGINTPVSCERIETDWGHGQEVQVTKTKIIPLKKAA